ncbi:hypothetical protein [Oceaniglobus roseus]|uniref:hypothetical protein n=1 Tax=Oceaniglobus roseus TaxID=1737570 RepID=UPI000C7F7956|nr:hypothetical protein [Kandeliimicrobium roseum]
MSFVQARLNRAFSTFLHSLKGSEKADMDAILADIRMMNNPSVHQNLGNPRLYTAGFWVRDLPAMKGVDKGANRLIYSALEQDANEKRRGLTGHVDVHGIGNPHDSSGFNQVKSFSQIKWLYH